MTDAAEVAKALGLALMPVSMNCCLIIEKILINLLHISFAIAQHGAVGFEILCIFPVDNVFRFVVKRNGLIVCGYSEAVVPAEKAEAFADRI